MSFMSCLVVIVLYTASVTAFEINTPPEVFYKMPGDDVKLPCKVTGDDYEKFLNPLEWHKNEERILNFQSWDPDYSSNERFPQPELIQDDGFQINPTIKDLQPEDTGNYTCKVINTDTHVTHQVWVLEKVHRLELLSSRLASDMKMLSRSESLTYEVGVNGYIECRAIGGIPPPTLVITDSSTDRQLDLKLNIETSMLDGKVNYTTSVYSPTMMFSRESDGHTLTCLASNPGGAHFEMTQSAKLDLLYKPALLEDTCTSQYTVEIGKPYHIKCALKAKPVPEVYWKVEATGEHMSVDPELIADHTYEVSLQFNRVTGDNVGNYKLFMRNSIGDEVFSVELLSGKIGEVGDNGGSILRSSPLLLLLLITFML